MFFRFYKNITKTWIKFKKITLPSKKHRQYESNTATKHSLCPGNGVRLTLTRPQATQFCNFVRLCFHNNKNTTLKKHKKH